MKAFMICACFLLLTQAININAQDVTECKSDEDCMENGQCVENVCQCSDGFVEVKKWLKKVCLPYASLENKFACEADEQCSLIEDETNPEGVPATCNKWGRTCQCKDSTWYPFQTDNQTYPFCVRGFGSTCDDDNQCQRSIEDAVCEENKCACPADFVTLEDEHMCLPYATEEDNHCIVNAQCGNMFDKFGPVLNRHPKCDNNTQSCVCHMDHFAIFNNTCVRGVGARCGFLRKCGIEHSRCSVTSMSCVCKFGYKPNEETNTCERSFEGKEAPKNPKPECETSEDCMKNAQCVENMCQCEEGFAEARHWLKKVCVPFATPDNEFQCNYDEQCSLIEDESNPRGEPATCKPWYNICGCKDSTFYPAQDEQSKHLFCARGFDSSCESDEQCQRNIQDGVCVENKCTCSEDYARVEDQQMCLPYATDEDNFCIIDEQCAKMDDSKGNWLNKHPVCDNSTSSCVCHAENWVLSNSTCVRGLGAHCGVMRNCGIEHSKCGIPSRICECEEGYVPNEETSTCEEVQVKAVDVNPTKKVLRQRT